MKGVALVSTTILEKEANKKLYQRRRADIVILWFSNALLDAYGTFRLLASSTAMLDYRFSKSLMLVLY